MFPGTVTFVCTVCIMRIAVPAAGEETVIHQKPTFMIHFLFIAAAESDEMLPGVRGAYSAYDRQNSDVRVQFSVYV